MLWKLGCFAETIADTGGGEREVEESERSFPLPNAELRLPHVVSVYVDRPAAYRSQPRYLRASEPSYHIEVVRRSQD